MNQEIYNKTGLTGINMILVWTLDYENGEKFPDLTDTNIPDHYKRPSYIYLKSGVKSDCLSFLKYSCTHDTESSWNPADLYGSGIINYFGQDTNGYEELESCLLPEIIEDSDPSTEYKFFGMVDISGAEMALLRLPENTWYVDVYSDSLDSSGSPIIMNCAEGNLLPGLYRDLIDLNPEPCIGITYGPTMELQNNLSNGDMYYNTPDSSDLTKVVSNIDYKKLIDELKAPKILAIEIHSSGIGNVNTINLPVEAWKLEKELSVNPERHKYEYYLGKTTLTEGYNPDINYTRSGTLIDSLSGVILGTNENSSSPIRDMISQESNLSSIIYPQWNSTVNYKIFDHVSYGGSIFESKSNGNIGNIPIFSGYWKYQDIDIKFPEIDINYNIAEINLSGSGKIYLKDGTEITGKIGTSEEYVDIQIIPDSGYILNGLYTYSYSSNSNCNNLTALSDKNTYRLQLGNGYGYKFCVCLDPVDCNIVTKYYVPGVNYYTFLGSGRYRDIDYTYSTFNHNNYDYLPNGEYMGIECSLDSEDLTESSYNSEGICISSSLDPLGHIVTVRYINILEYYSVSRVNVSQYRGSDKVESYDIFKDIPDSETWSIDGSDLLVSFIPTESVSHIKLSLIPNPIDVHVESEEGIDVSTIGEQINIGESLNFQVYSESRPSSIDKDSDTFTFDYTITASSTNNVWDIYVYNITGSGKIIIKK